MKTIKNLIIKALEIYSFGLFTLFLIVLGGLLLFEVIMPLFYQFLLLIFKRNKNITYIK